jgi:hypothetical protein
LEKLKKERLISMSTSKILYQISKLVKEILENDKRARNSDTYLYLQVLYKVGLIKGIDVNAMSVTEFLLKRNELGFPCYETCSRARRKVQEEHPELAGSDAVEAQRIINERVYRDFARRNRSE